MIKKEIFSGKNGINTHVLTLCKTKILEYLFYLSYVYNHIKVNYSNLLRKEVY